MRIVWLVALTAFFPAASWGSDLCGPGDGGSVINRIINRATGGSGGGGGGGASSAAMTGGYPASADQTGRIWLGDTQEADEGLYGKVFEDVNRDGWPNKGERGIPGVRIFSDTHAETRTNDQGDYMMKALEIGERTIQVDPSTVPSSFAFTTPSAVRVRVFGGVKSRVSFGVNPGHSELPETAI